MNKIKSFLSKIGKGIARFFRFVFSWIIHFFREFVRVNTLPIHYINIRRVKKGKKPFALRIISWSNKDEPEDEEVRKNLNRLRIYRLITFSILCGLIAIFIAIFGLPFGRAMASLNYMKDGAVFIFQTWFMEETSETGETIVINTPEISNMANEQFQAILADIKSFWYYFQVMVGCLFNKDIVTVWGYEALNGLTNLLKFIDWIPVFVMVVILFKRMYAKPTPDDEAGPTKSLIWFDETFLPRFWRPIKYRIQDYWDYLFRRDEWNCQSAFEENSWDKVIFHLSWLSCCIIGWTILDAITSYLIMVMAFSFSWFPTFLASVLIDAIVLFVRLGVPGTILVFSYISYKSLKRIAQSKLFQMQRNNEDIAESLPVITAINGPVGVGKTTMMSSIAIDGESMFRDYFLSVMQKYQSAFPSFDWRMLEAWVIKGCEEENNKEGKKNRTEAIFHTRSQLKASLKILYNKWKEVGYNFTLENGSTAFFNYNPENGLFWYDGARQIELLEACQSYAESYFMYFSGQRLATSNYPIAFDKLESGLYFKIYGQASSYLSFGSKPRSTPRNYSHIFNMDFFRVNHQINEKDESRKASIDGGVVAMTEASNERGNRFDYIGKSKGDSNANPLNDGWNKALRLVRHWFMVDGKPCCMFIYDYQRGDSMNAEARDSAEDTIIIMNRSEEGNTIPFWNLIDTVCSIVENWWKNYFWYTWKPNRAKDTLVNRILAYICGFFISKKQMLRYSYGYEVATFNREHGGMNGLTGERSIESYFFIYKKVRSGMFKSDVYDPILRQSSLSAKQGWMDMPTYKGVEAKSEDFSLQNSYFLEGISELFSKYDAAGAAKRLREKQIHGTDSPFVKDELEAKEDENDSDKE